MSMVLHGGSPEEASPRDISAGQKLRKVTSANNERESYADYKLDYPNEGTSISPVAESFLVRRSKEFL